MSVPKDFYAVTRDLGAAADASADTARSQNLRTLQFQIDAIARGDFAVVLQDACEDVTLEIFVPVVRAAIGSGAFRDAPETNFAAVAGQKPHIVDLFSEGDKVVPTTLNSFSASPSGTVGWQPFK